MRFGKVYSGAQPNLSNAFGKIYQLLNNIHANNQESDDQARLKELMTYRKTFAPTDGMQQLQVPGGGTTSVPNYTGELKEESRPRSWNELDPAAITEMLMMKSGAGEKALRGLMFSKELSQPGKPNVTELNRGAKLVDPTTGRVIADNPWPQQQAEAPSAYDQSKQELALKILEQELANKRESTRTAQLRNALIGKKPPAGTKPAASKKSDILMALNRLKTLYDNEGITEEDYNDLSAELLRSYKDDTLTEDEGVRKQRRVEEYLNDKQSVLGTSTTSKLKALARRAAGANGGAAAAAQTTDTVLDYVPGKGLIQK